MQWRAGVLALVAMSPWACGDDQLRKATCIDSENAFDIDQVSALEGAYSVPGGGDAVILDANTDKVPADGTWRVGSVDVLVTVPDADFETYPHDVKLVVQVWDNENPNAVTPWEVTQTLDLSALQWETEQLPDPDAPRRTITYRHAWWKFPFSSVIPESGMHSKRYIIGARWLSDLPFIGASKFNRPCASNWSDYDNGEGWVLNGRTGGNTCNWPMFRVGSEVITQKVSCE